MYDQSISRAHRTAFVIAIDQSGSMRERIVGSPDERTKADQVASITNTLLFELIERARRHDGIRDYYDVAVIGYSGRGVYPLLGEEWWIPIDRLAAQPTKDRERVVERILPDGGESLVRLREPQWVTPRAEGNTPMYAMFCEVLQEVRRWCDDPRHRASFPPMLFNITDGEASDCDDEGLREICGRLQQVGTQDGTLLLLNTHISSQSGEPSILFPHDRSLLGENRYARLLYDCSSEMPSCFNSAIREAGYNQGVGPFRGMSYNGSMHELASLLNIGSVTIPIR